MFIFNQFRFVFRDIFSSCLCRFWLVSYSTHTSTISHKQLYLFSEPKCHKVLFFYWLQLVDRDYQLPQLLDLWEIQNFKYFSRKIWRPNLSECVQNTDSVSDCRERTDLNGGRQQNRLTRFKRFLMLPSSWRNTVFFLSLVLLPAPGFPDNLKLVGSDKHKIVQNFLCLMPNCQTYS